MKFHVKFALAFLLVLMAIAIFAPSSQSDYAISNLSKKKSEKISLEIADNDFSRMRGLMFRDKIIPILFIFGYEGKFPIHSHFVKAEFDAIYVSQGGTVVEVFRRIAPEQDRISPQKVASFLLELPPELTDRLKIGVGDRVEWKKLGLMD